MAAAGLGPAAASQASTKRISVVCRGTAAGSCSHFTPVFSAVAQGQGSGAAWGFMVIQWWDLGALPLGGSTPAVCKGSARLRAHPLPG